LPLVIGAIGFAQLGAGSVIGVAIQLAAATAAGIIYVRRPRVHNPGEIVVDDRGVWMWNELVAKMEDIVGLSVTSTAQGTRLTSISLKNGSTVELVLDTDVHVAELRQALGLALARSASRRFQGHATLGCLGSLAAFVSAIVATIWTAMLIDPNNHIVLWGTLVPTMLIAVPLLFGRIKKVTATCGEEGVHIKRLIGSRFIRYDEISDVVASFGKIVVIRTAKRTYNIELPSNEDATAMIENIRQRSSMPKAEGDENLGAILARGDRSNEAWLDAVRRQASAVESSYRTQHLAEDRLWTVLEDPSADPTARVAAAVALRTTTRTADPKMRVQIDQRVRIAASTTAFPQVRIALEEIADAATEDEIPARVMQAMRNS